MEAMPVFKVFRLKESQYQQFRWAPHTAGAADVKPKDYESDGEIESPTAYTAWNALKESGSPLRVGDLLQSESGDLRICKYVGLEEAHWVLPEAKLAEGQPAAPQAGQEM
jgi:hypothetical protein